MYSSFGFEHDTEMYMCQYWVWFYIFTILLHCNVVTAMEIKKKNTKEYKLIFPNVCRFSFPFNDTLCEKLLYESQHQHLSHIPSSFIHLNDLIKPLKSLDRPSRICIVTKGLFTLLKTGKLQTVTLRIEHKYSRVQKMQLACSILTSQIHINMINMITVNVRPSCRDRFKRVT